MVYLVLADGFEEIEAITSADILRRAKIGLQIAGVGGLMVRGAHEISVKADIDINDMNFEELEMLILPGGGEGVANLDSCPKVIEALEYALKNDRYVSAICAAPTILGKRGWLDGKKAVCYPGMEADMGKAVLLPGKTAADGKLITGQSPDAAMEFALLITQTLKDTAMAKTVSYFLVHDR